MLSGYINRMPPHDSLVCVFVCVLVDTLELVRMRRHTVDTIRDVLSLSSVNEIHALSMAYSL